ncbi:MULTISPECIES: sigma-70 family RNA polymerase sigma factor [Micromonospora]|uniref:sigma-70 family RNA polymerase sigma factor n=1 Tax=Micromonospora TaxID=1873 RepID=UPI001AE6626E|nr:MULTISPECIES: sigma-70 family RNA polymerase sigma factor [unclassified Micromonospora]MBP1785189.1 hypothetical protein [Micromonospora sp. HB375]MDH6472479.1 hypothetical protein [Micromonospora sp. H404/HB375]
MKRGRNHRDSTADRALRTPDDFIAALEQLTTNERSVLLLRFWAYQTLSEMAERLGVTRERVRQIENRAIWKLQGHEDSIDIMQSALTSGTWKAVLKQYSDLLEPYVNVKDREMEELERFDREYDSRHGSCEVCNQEFNRTRNGRPRRFCSSSCRQMAYRLRRQSPSRPPSA